jgi:hypothetical protein
MTTDAGSTRELPRDNSPRNDMSRVSGETPHMGSEDPRLDEAPRDQETVHGFWMDPHTVTQWLTATGWTTAP